MDIPQINKRIRQLVEYKTKGVVSRFAKLIGISQQRLSRLFNIDSKTGKIPIVSTEILVEITRRLVEIDSYWLLTGKGKMLKQEEMVVSGCNIIGNNSNITHQVEDNNKEIVDLQAQVKDLKHEVELLKKDNKILSLELVNMSNVVDKLKEKGKE